MQNKIVVAVLPPDDDLIPLDKMFELWAKFEDPKCDGKKITLRAIDKWFKQANQINKQLTMTDTGVAFNKFKMKGIDFKDFNKFIEDLAKTKKLNFEDFKYCLMACGIPGETNQPPPKKDRRT